MADPATTTRSSPVGAFLKDGYQTLIAFAADPDVSFWEKAVQPFGMDGGDAIDNTTMHNTTYRVMRSRSLITATDITSTVAYDPEVLDQIVALLNVETDVTVHHSNSDTWDFYGFLRSFTPQENTEGSQPEAEIVITPTNYDPDADVEAGPNFISAAGTD